MTIKRFILKVYRKVERALNNRHAYDYPPTLNGWAKFGNTPIWGDKTTGSMFDPYCFLLDNKFKMLVSDRKQGALILLSSDDGISWTKESDILFGENNKWDSTVNRGCILKCDNRYILWYTGQSETNCSIGIAVSDDCKTFKRIKDKPILLADKDCEGISVMNPCVLWDNDMSVFKMWYSAGESYEPDVICYAESEDGISWQKHTSPILMKCPEHKWEKYKIGGCQVIKANDIYEMYYIGYQNLDVARICFAKSKDGLIWSREDDNLLISPTKDSWDSDAVYKPTILKHGELSYLWYNGRKGAKEYIGLAIHGEDK